MSARGRSGESKGAASGADGGTEQVGRQLSARADAPDEQQNAPAEQQNAAVPFAKDSNADSLYASGNLMPSAPTGMPSDPSGEIGTLGAAAAQLGPAPTPPSTAERMIAEVNGDSPPWGGEPMQRRSFGTEVDPNTLGSLVDTEHSKSFAAEEYQSPPGAPSTNGLASLGAAMAGGRTADAIIDAGIRADELALMEEDEDEAIMNQIVGEYGASSGAFGAASTGFTATSSTALSSASSEAEDLLSLTALRKEVAVAHQLMSTGEIIEGLMDETTVGDDPVEMETPK